VIGWLHLLAKVQAHERLNVSGATSEEEVNAVPVAVLLESLRVDFAA
jgi:hypothetical protein